MDNRIAEAKALLEREGYKVSPKPSQWHEVNVVVTFKVRMTKPVTKDFVRAVEQRMQLDTLERAQTLISPDIEMIGKITAKNWNKVKARARLLPDVDLSHG